MISNEKAFQQILYGPKKLTETIEKAHGIDLDYILDFIKYCQKGKAAMFCWPSLADKWKKQYGAEVDSKKLASAAMTYQKEKMNNCSKN
jgi:hypothetical protein